MNDIDITPAVIGIAGMGLSIIAFISQELRATALLLLFIIVSAAAVYLRILQIDTYAKQNLQKLTKLKESFAQFEKQQDIYKNIYKLQATMKKLMKKGEFNPGWILAALAVIAFLYVLFRALSV